MRNPVYQLTTFFYCTNIKFIVFFMFFFIISQVALVKEIANLNGLAVLTSIWPYCLKNRQEFVRKQVSSEHPETDAP